MRTRKQTRQKWRRVRNASIWKMKVLFLLLSNLPSRIKHVPEQVQVQKIRELDSLFPLKQRVRTTQRSTHSSDNFPSKLKPAAILEMVNIVINFDAELCSFLWLPREVLSFFVEGSIVVVANGVVFAPRSLLLNLLQFILLRFPCALPK